MMNTSITPVPLTSITQQGRVVTGPLTQADYEEMKRHTRDWRGTLLLMLFRATGFGPRERAVGAAGLAALGRHVMPKEFRRLYIVTVAEIAAQVVGYAPQHMEIAQKMVGHERVNTTWDWYVMLSTDQRRAIQERVPV